MTDDGERNHDREPDQVRLVDDGDRPDPRLLDALVEALLLVAPQPASPEDLADAAGIDAETVEAVLVRLGTAEGRGWVLVRHGGLVSLASAPRFAPQVRRFLRLEREARLTGAALETLAVIAYRQPVSRPEIEAVRGVDCSGVVATLHARGLVEQIGRGAGLGSPILYGTTAAFLHHFGLRSLDDLPPLGEISGKDAATLLGTEFANTGVGSWNDEQSMSRPGNEAADTAFVAKPASTPMDPSDDPAGAVNGRASGSLP